MSKKAIYISVSIASVAFFIGLWLFMTKWVYIKTGEEISTLRMWRALIEKIDNSEVKISWNYPE